MVKFVAKMELVHLTVLLSAIFTVNGNQIDVTPDSNTVQVRPGEEAMMVCKSSSPISFCIFQQEGAGSPYIIQEGITHDNGRITKVDDEACGIKISPVKDEDAGNWKCSITSITDGVSTSGDNTISLTVLKAPTSVTLNAVSIEVTPDEPEAKARCTIAGGDPTPTFKWTLDDAPVDVAIVDSGEEADAHFQEVTLTPGKNDNGKRLECVADSKAYTEEDLTNGLNKASAVLDVQYAPEFQKDVYKFYGLQAGSPFEISISFRLNPLPTNINWNMHDGTIVPMGSESEDGKYTSNMPVASDEEPTLHTVLLTINDVTEKDGATTNKLVVSNAFGTAEISFQLEMGDKPPTGEDSQNSGPGALNDEAGTGPVIAIVIIILLVIVVIAVAVVARAQGMLCFAARDGVNDPEKGKFSALEKEEDATPEKENKDILKKDPADSAPVSAPSPATTAEKPPAGGDSSAAPVISEVDEKKSNGAHSPNK